MWQNNVSWKEGLFSEIPFMRFQAINTKSQWDSPLAIFTLLKPNEGNDWSNLQLMGIQSPTTPTTKRIDTLFASNYYIVAIDMRVRTTEYSVKVETQDKVTGKARVLIQYQVSNPETILKNNDPISILRDKIQKILQEYISQTDYLTTIETAIDLNDAVEISGISVLRMDYEIQWSEQFPKDVLDKIERKKQNNLNRLKINKLKEFGIYNPTLVASVLSQNDSEFDAIVRHIRAFSLAHQSETERNINLLNWLKENDLLTKTDVQKVIEALETSNNKETSSSKVVFDKNTNINNSAIGNNSVIVNKPPTPPENNSTTKTDEGEKKFRISVSFPRLLSKRFDSVFLFQLYLPESRSLANKNMRAQFAKQPKLEFADQSKVKIGQKIQAELYGSQFNFSKPVIKVIDKSLIKIVFLGLPKDTCQPGNQNVLVSLLDAETQQEIESFNIGVKVVDFAFDHISRPLLSRVSAVALGIGSFVMFILTILEQIDKTIGLTSGTAAGVLALTVYAVFYNLYQRVRPSTP